MSKQDQKRKKYYLNDNYFENKTLQSCYFAGLLAADGCISSKGNSITLSLQVQDKSILELLTKELDSNLRIVTRIEKQRFECCKIEFASFKNKQTLKDLYNLTTRKSLTLTPPNLNNPIDIDSFIVGYIDGDGSIFLQTALIGRNPVLTISVLGTLEVLSWIQKRFHEILGKEVGGCLRRKRSNGKNTYTLTFTNTMARNLFKHYYKIPVVKLDRKWREDYYTHCNTFKIRQIR